MTRKKFLPLSRRGFIKLIGSISVLLMFSNPLQLYAGSLPSPLITFAQTTDVHIVDNGNKLRFEELLYAGYLGHLGIIPSESLPSPISRPTDDRTAYNWDRVIRSINTEHQKEPFNFVIDTGDVTDTNLKNELKWFIQIANGGPLSDDYYRTDKKPMLLPDYLEGFQMPWYATLGNHDVEYQGSINNLQVVEFLDEVIAIMRLTYPDDMKDLCSQKEALASYLKAGGNPNGHGFANMPEPIYPFTIKEGYYSFDPAPFIHCIVLNTANYRPETMFGQEGYREFFSEGYLNARQFIWMNQDIKNNANKLCLVFSHHPKPYMYSATKDQLAKTLSSYPNVIALIAGHTHENKIEQVKYSNNGYWRITTNAAVTEPNEWRSFTVTADNGNGTGTISTRVNNADGTVQGNDDPNRDRDLKFTIPPKVQEYMNSFLAPKKQITLKSLLKSIFGLGK